MNVSIFYFFYNLTQAHGWLAQVALFFSNYAVYILPIVVVGYVVLVANRPIKKILYAGVVVAAAMLLSELLKQLFSIPRPFITLDLTPIATVANYSFPSIHATYAGAMFLAVYFLISKRSWFTVGVAIVCIAIAVSRVMLGVHYPIDIIVGFALGMLCAFAAHKMLVETV